MRERQEFTREFRLKAVRLSEETVGTIKQVALDLGIRPELLYRWRGAYLDAVCLDASAESLSGAKDVPDSEDEVRALRQELERVKQERDVLKKALAIFSTAE